MQIHLPMRTFRIFHICRIDALICGAYAGSAHIQQNCITKPSWNPQDPPWRGSKKNEVSRELLSLHHHHNVADLDWNWSLTLTFTLAHHLDLLALHGNHLSLLQNFHLDSNKQNAKSALKLTLAVLIALSALCLRKSSYPCQKEAVKNLDFLKTPGPPV